MVKHTIRQHITVILLFFVSFNLSANYYQEKDHLSRKEKKDTEREQIYQFHKEILKDGEFVPESNFLQNRYSNRIPVNSTINFIKANEGSAVIQIGSDAGLGYNGVGGITAKGNITKWKVKENDKKKSIDLTMDIMTSIGIYHLNMSIGTKGL